MDQQQRTVDGRTPAPTNMKKYLPFAPGSTYMCIYTYIHVYMKIAWCLNPSATWLCHYVSEGGASKSKNFWKWIISKEFLETTHWWHTLMTVLMFVMKDIKQIPQVYVTNSEPARSCFKWLSQVQKPRSKTPNITAFESKMIGKRTKKTSF